VADKKEEKVSPKSSKQKGRVNYLKSKKFKKDLKETLVFSVFYVPFMAILWGTLTYHFPDPIPLFLGLYIDMGQVISLLAVPLYLILVTIIMLPD
jgi:hypothetical protein